MLRILIADDSNAMRASAREILEDEGHEVVGEASDGVQALRMLRDVRPDVVLLDLVMPGPCAIEVLAGVREVDPTAHVVVCQSLGQESMSRVAIAMGARDVVTKPLQPDSLLGVLDRLERKGPHRFGVYAAPEGLRAAS